MSFALEKHRRTLPTTARIKGRRKSRIATMFFLCYCPVFFYFLIIRCMDGPKVRAIIKVE